MERIAVIVARAVWAILVFAWAWSLLTGSAVRPLHPVNLIASAALLVGVACVWWDRPWARLTSGAAAIVASVIMGIQYFVLSGMFGGDTQFRSSWGPLQFEGFAARLAFVGPPIFLILSSSILAWKAADRIDGKDEKNA